MEVEQTYLAPDVLRVRKDEIIAKLPAGNEHRAQSAFERLHSKLILFEANASSHCEVSAAQAQRVLWYAEHLATSPDTDLLSFWAAALGVCGLNLPPRLPKH